MTASAERAELVVGAAVLAVAAGFLLWSTGGLGGGFGGLGQSGYPLRAAFPSVDGVEKGTEVRLAGVRIGRVTEVRLNPETYYAEAELRVPDTIRLPEDSAALIQSDGLLGGSYIELQPGGSDQMLAPGDEIEDVQGAVSLLALMMKFVDSQGGAKDDAAEAAGGPRADDALPGGDGDHAAGVAGAVTPPLADPPADPTTAPASTAVDPSSSPHPGDVPLSPSQTSSQDRLP